MYCTSPIPVRDNVATRTAQEEFGSPRCSIVHACNNYPVRWADKVGHEDPNQADLSQSRSEALSRLDGIIALYLGNMNFFGTPLFLSVAAPITNSYDYVNENSQCQDYSDDLTKTPRVFARLDN